MDHKKLVDLGLGLAGLVVFWVFFHTINTLTNVMGWSLLKDSPIGIDVIAGLIAGVSAFVGLRSNKRIFIFVEEVVGELSKVTWPARKETLVSGAVVLVLVGIASLIMSLFDSVWGSVAQKILTF